MNDPAREVKIEYLKRDLLESATRRGEFRCHQREILLQCPGKNVTLERWDTTKFTWHEKDMAQLVPGVEKGEMLLYTGGLIPLKNDALKDYICWGSHTEGRRRAPASTVRIPARCRRRCSPPPRRVAVLEHLESSLAQHGRDEADAGRVRLDLRIQDAGVEHLRAIRPPVEMVRDDIRHVVSDPALVDAVLKDIDVVIHLAAISKARCTAGSRQRALSSASQRPASRKRVSAVPGS